jgi:hypothetical protein
MQRIPDHGHREESLAFFLEGVAEVSEDFCETVFRILPLRDAHRAAITSLRGRAAGNGGCVLGSSGRMPAVPVSDMQDPTEAACTATCSVVFRLGGHGTLRKATRHQRNRVFPCQPCPNLFRENSANSSEPLS